jgi:hypothetical protein
MIISVPTALADKADKPAKADSAEKVVDKVQKIEKVEKVEKVDKRTIADCTAFDQADKGDDGVSFTIHNSCTIPLDCAVSWHVVCAPASKKRRAVHASSVKLALATATDVATDATASACGDDSWQIDSVEWSCQPNKD